MKNFCKKHKTSLIVGAICLLFSSVFVMLFSYCTSPVYGDFYGGYTSQGVGYDGDVAQFLTIGRAWSEGQIPYRDIFDHKGPLIFLINAIGFALGSKAIICVLQIIGLAVTLFFVYKICSLVSPRKIYFLLVTTFILVFLTASYTEGNSVQEYCLPFITASIYFICKFLLSKKPKKHSWKIGLFYGISVGVCLMTQATNAIPIGAGVIAIIVVLLKQKSFQNLWQNLLAGLGGILLVCVPFAIYFAINNAFGDFIFATFVFNFSYLSSASSWLTNINATKLILFATAYIGYICLIPTLVFAFLRKKYYYMIFLIIAFVLESYLFFSSSLYVHYAIIALPQFALLMNELFLLKKSDTSLDMIRTCLLVIILFIAGGQFLSILASMPDKYHAIHHPQEVGYEKLISPYLDDIKNTSIIVGEGNQLKDFYLKYDVPVVAKFFTLQGWHSGRNKQIHDEIDNQFRTTDAEYILLDRPLPFTETVQQRYDLVGSDQQYSLYKIKK